MGAPEATDFDRISREARERLVAEVHRTVSDVSAAVEEAMDETLAAAETEARRELIAERVVLLANEGLDSLRDLSAELVDRAAELEREVSRLATWAAEAAAALRGAAPDMAEPETAEVSVDPYEPPPSLGPESPLDELEAYRREFAEAPSDFPPRRTPAGDAATRPVDIPPAVRVVVEQLRIAGEPDASIAVRLQRMGVDDPEAVLAQVRKS